MPNYRNVSFATAASVAHVLDHGCDVVVRGKATRELVARVTGLERPLERYLFLPARHNDVFAQFAQAMWALAGRDDIDWLSAYLPRAPDFSDDGRTWRGAYGPRLRSWNGHIDQLDEVRRLLIDDQASRRAVMSLFDPARDFVNTKDVPCNNWLSWIAREGELHLAIAVRSNDAMWGFSGANAFEWSILHELMAFWLGLKIGRQTYFAGSFHLYEHHFERARRIAGSFHGFTPYDFGIGRAGFRTEWKDFQKKLDQWFSVEAAIRSDPDVSLYGHGRTGDPLLDSGLALVHLHWAQSRWASDRLADELSTLPAEDFVVAAYEQLGRSHPALVRDVSQSFIADFFDACRGRTLNLPNDFRNAVKHLHAVKDKAYGGAWKRRGELVSILPNIARKSDRLETLIATKAQMRGETMLDTAVDLLVYVEKYRLFLAEGLDEGELLPPGSPQPLSDHDQNLDALLDRLDLEPGDRAISQTVSEIVRLFDLCWRLAEVGAQVRERLEMAGRLALAAGSLVARLVVDNGAIAAAFVRSETP